MFVLSDLVFIFLFFYCSVCTGRSHPLKPIHCFLNPGLESHPQHQLAKKQMRGFSGMVTFFIKGGKKESSTFLKTLKVLDYWLASLGEGVGGGVGCVCISLQFRCPTFLFTVCVKMNLSNINSGLHENIKIGMVGKGGGGGGIMYSKE